MSYILDALKKIDHEKNKRNPDGRINISGDLFRERTRQARSLDLWKVALLLVAVALVTCGTTLLILRGNPDKKVVANAQVVPPLSVVAAPISVNSEPAAAAATASPGHAGMSAAAPYEKTRTKMRRNAEKVPSMTPPAQTAAVPADIKLSGIAWQEERAERRAVINGFLLKEGGVVSGAKITDIQADKVFFSSSIGEFHIKLDAALPVEVKR